MSSIATGKQGAGKDMVQRCSPYVFIVFASAFVALYGESFYEICRGYYSGEYLGLITSTMTYGVAARTCLLFLISIAVSFAFFKLWKHLSGYIYRFRYLIAGVILAICTIFEISGSSVGCWSPYLNEPASSTTLFGIPRAIRSDEWLVNLPTFLSQSFNDYGTSSSILRGTITDTTMPISAPSWSLATLFHPFQWGYLVFGSAKGVAFEWTSAKLALIMVSFECAMLYTRKNKALSAAAAIMLSFSPLILWWNTGAALVFGQGLVIALYHLVNRDSFKVKLIASIALAWLAGCYLMMMYPAWQVPFFFIFAVFGIWVILSYRKNTKGGSPELRTFAPRKSILLLLLCCIAVVVMIVLVFVGARDALLATTSTAYPSGRVSTGGGLIPYLFGYGSSIFLPLSSGQINASELSVMFTLFPLGLIAGCVNSYKRKDMLSRLLVTLEIIFLIYGIFGFPEWLSRITLFSYIPTQRLLFPLGCIDIFLLIRALSQCDRPLVKTRPATLIATGLVSLSIFIACLSNALFDMLFAEKITMLIAIMLICTPCILALVTRFSVNMFAASIACVLLSTGLCVNPIQKGLDPLTDSALYSEVKQIAESNPTGLWIAEDTIAMANFCVAAGAPTINSTNAYPDLERWEALDQKGDYAEIYNRYAHIIISLQNDTDTEFSLQQDDAFQVILNWEDVDKLDVSYILTQKEYPASPSEGIELTLLAQNNGYNIYSVDDI
ncbi:hypothetical protein [Gordonibacter sp. RACS_AR49]|uniref:DUF7657 domain-containing protein n=1 Tax=Gordonibacter sp. RACS_AR49 TaxID=2871986 RepID=UPI00262265D8|nr:hypothetical protein [Gordonibacter sp. RACS_AR49]MDN4509935.1 hypothetical protein [Gordonibacter sp. RACS_AR49]